MHEILTELDIAATPDRVWSILTDLAAYPAWSPFIRSITGRLETGQRLSVSIQPAGGPGQVHFTQRERFSGATVGLAKSSLDRGTRAGFPAMNNALKARAESVSNP
jgi:hypothetical protein